MSSDAQDIYQAMVKAGYSEDDIKREIQSKTREFQGFMTKEGALYLVAKELGIKLNSGETVPDDIEHEELGYYDEDIDYDEFAVPISVIQPGVSNIVILGRIVEVFPPREFQRKDGTGGIVGSFVIIDKKEDSIKVVLWGEKTKVMNNEYFGANEIIRVVGGYAKESREGAPEVHIGNKGKVMLAPKDVNLRLIPIEVSESDVTFSSSSVNRNIKKIEELEDTEGFVKFIAGNIGSIDLKEVKKKDGGLTFLLKMKLNDKTSSIDINVWGDQAIYYLKTLNEEEYYIFSNVSIRYNPFSQSNEVYFTRLTKLHS